MHRENTPEEIPENTKDKTRKASQDQRQQPDKSAAATLWVSQLPTPFLALGALVGLSAVGVSSVSDPDIAMNSTAKSICKIANTDISPITETVTTAPGTTMNFSGPCSATFTTPTPPGESLGTAVIIAIALGAVFVVVAAGLAGVCAYRYCQRSSTKAGRNQPMPEYSDSQPWTDRPLPDNTQHYYELLSVMQENTVGRDPWLNSGTEQCPDCPL